MFGSSRPERRMALLMALVLTVVSVTAAPAQTEDWAGPAALAVEVRGDDGKPVEGAIVTLRVADRTPAVGPPAATTDDHGRVEIEHLGELEWYVEVSHDSFMLYAAYIKVKANKKPVTGFSSQVNTATSWTPMRIKFAKGKADLSRKLSKKERRAERQLAEFEHHTPEARQPVPPPATAAAGAAKAPDAAPKSISAAAAPAATAPTIEARQPAPDEVSPETAAPVDTESEAAERAAEEARSAAEAARLETQAKADAELAAEEQEAAAAAAAHASREAAEREAAEQAAIQAEATAQANAARAAEEEAAAEEAAAAAAAEQRAAAEAAQREAAERAAIEAEAAARATAERVAAEQAAERAAAEAEAAAEKAKVEVAEREAAELAAAEAAVAAKASAERAAAEQAAAEEAAANRAAAEQAAADEAAAAAATEADSAMEAAEGEAAEPPPVTVQVPSTPPSTPSAAAPATSPSPPRPIPSYMASAAQGTCAGCQPGEWSIIDQETVANARDSRGGGCPVDPEVILAGVRELVESVDPSFTGTFSSALIPSRYAPVAREPRAAIRQKLGEYLQATSSCRLVGVLLPAGSAFSGYQYEAWGAAGGGACVAGSDCPVGRARWDREPTLVEGSVTAVFAFFHNRSERYDRRAKFTVFFAPPSTDWNP